MNYEIDLNDISELTDLIKYNNLEEIEEVIKKIPQSIWNKTENLKKLIESNPEIIQYFPVEHRNDKDLVLLALSKNHTVIKLISESLRNEREVMLIAIKSDPFNIEYSKKLMADNDFMLFDLFDIIKPIKRNRKPNYSRDILPLHRESSEDEQKAYEIIDKAYFYLEFEPDDFWAKFDFLTSFLNRISSLINNNEKYLYEIDFAYHIIGFYSRLYREKVQKYYSTSKDFEKIKNIYFEDKIVDFLSHFFDKKGRLNMEIMVRIVEYPIADDLFTLLDKFGWTHLELLNEFNKKHNL